MVIRTRSSPLLRDLWRKRSRTARAIMPSPFPLRDESPVQTIGKTKTQFCRRFLCDDTYGVFSRSSIEPVFISLSLEAASHTRTRSEGRKLACTNGSRMRKRKQKCKCHSSLELSRART